jgi:hypothetical protein
MTFFSEPGLGGSRLPVVAAQSFVLEQLVTIHATTLDMRWAMVELAWRSFTGMCAFVQGRLAAWIRRDRTPRQEEGNGRHCCC